MHPIRRANGRSVQDQSGDFVLHGVSDRQRAALTEAENNDRIPCARPDDAPQILDAFLLRRRPGGRVGQARPKLVVSDDAATPGEAAYKPAVAQQLPLQIQMRVHARHHDQVRWTGPHNLVRQRPARTLHISGLQGLHSCQYDPPYPLGSS
jgi:hypothetical protein